MPSNYPASLDSFADPAGGVTQGSTTPTHSGHHQNHNDAIEAIEAKLGTGASTPAANTVLRGTGAGTTAFGQVATGDLTANAVSQVGSVSPTASQTTTATALTTMAGSTVNMTTTGGPVLLLATLTLSNSSAGQLEVVYLAVDGTPVAPGTLTTAANASGWATVSIVKVHALAAGAHAFSIQWYTTAGTMTLQEGMLSAVELKK